MGKYGELPWWGIGMILAAVGVGVSCMTDNWPCEHKKDRVEPAPEPGPPPPPPLPSPS
jgi:hypothetical protein